MNLRDYSHIPDVDSWSGLLTLLWFCNYFELYCATIGWSFNSQSDVRSFEMAIKNRSRARALVAWVFRTHDLEDPHGNIIMGLDALSILYSKFLAQQACVLISVEMAARKQQLESDFDHLEPEKVEDNVVDCLMGGPAWMEFKAMYPHVTSKSFHWDGLKYKVIGGKDNTFGASLLRACNSAVILTYLAADFPYVDGLVYGDLKVAHRLKVSLGGLSSRELSKDTIAGPVVHGNLCNDSLNNGSAGSGHISSSDCLVPSESELSDPSDYAIPVALNKRRRNASTSSENDSRRKYNLPCVGCIVLSEPYSMKRPNVLKSIIDNAFVTLLSI
ncbi:hypothetical protein C0992_011795 [Termitomyces sp. T32_za158]|nr:hypothetical protein C0992_011795 [Termitomyces sp. T32_za158]